MMKFQSACLAAFLSALGYTIVPEPASATLLMVASVLLWIRQDSTL